MSESKYFSAPWFVRDNIVYHKTFGEIATVWPSEYPNAGDEGANARLIAAAPDLLAAALEYIEFSCDDKSDGCPCCEAENHLHAAITRALGEPS